MNEFDCLAEAMKRKGEPEEMIQRCLRKLRQSGLTPNEIPPDKAEDYIRVITSAKERCEVDPEFSEFVDRKADEEYRRMARGN
jgi:hypothetical protein